MDKNSILPGFPAGFSCVILAVVYYPGPTSPAECDAPTHTQPSIRQFDEGAIYILELWFSCYR